MSVTTARAQLDASITEKAWMAAVVEYARWRGWLVYHPFDSRRSQPGFPDLCMTRSLSDGDRRIIFAELKSAGGKTSRSQRTWLHALGMVAELTNRVEVYLWEPADWPEVQKVLL